MVCFIRLGGLLQEGLHLLFVRLFVSIEFLRHFQHVATYILLERICPVTLRQAGRGRREAYTGLWWGNLRVRDHMEDPGADGWIILRWIFRKWDVGVWTE